MSHFENEFKKFIDNRTPGANRNDRKIARDFYLSGLKRAKTLAAMREYPVKAILDEITKVEAGK